MILFFILRFLIMSISTTLKEIFNKYPLLIDNVIDLCFVSTDWFLNKNNYVLLNANKVKSFFLPSKIIFILQNETSISSVWERNVLKMELVYKKDAITITVDMFYNNQRFTCYFEVYCLYYILSHYFYFTTQVKGVGP